MKILILQPNMVVGGIEKSLLNFLELFKNDHEIDLFLLSNKGEFLANIDTKKVNIITSKNAKHPKNMINEIFRKFAILTGMKSYFKKTQFLMQKEYDVAICYHGMNLELLKIMKLNVIAKKKVAIIHGDPSRLNKRILKESLSVNDKVACVSKSCSNELIKMFPSFDNKISFIYNPQNSEEIIQKSKEYVIEYEDKQKVHLLSVARLGREKGHLRLLGVAKKLISEGITDFHIHLVGDGEMYHCVRDTIKNDSLEDCVTMYGNKINPYPYFINADLFVLMSYHEAAPMVIGECSLLKLPILSTKTISAEEMIGEAGLVCENSDLSLYLHLKDLILNKKDKTKDYNFSKILDNKDYKKIIEKLLMEA